MFHNPPIELYNLHPYGPEIFSLIRGDRLLMNDQAQLQCNALETLAYSGYVKTQEGAHQVWL
jgi:hypothetical protein